MEVCTIGINVFWYERDIVLLVCKILEVEPQQYKSLYRQLKKDRGEASRM